MQETGHTDRSRFHCNWVSQSDCFCITRLPWQDWPKKKSCHKSFVTRLYAFSRALCQLHVLIKFLLVHWSYLYPLWLDRVIIWILVFIARHSVKNCSKGSLWLICFLISGGRVGEVWFLYNNKVSQAIWHINAFQNHSCLLCLDLGGPPNALFIPSPEYIVVSCLFTDTDINTRSSRLTRMKTEITLFSLLYSTANEASTNCCQTFLMNEQAGRKISNIYTNILSFPCQKMFTVTCKLRQLTRLCFLQGQGKNESVYASIPRKRQRVPGKSGFYCSNN